MDFFRSILSDDPDPETPHTNSQSDTNQPSKHPQNSVNDSDSDSSSNVNSSESGVGLWSFGDLVKTLTTRSESVLETYRRDLKEFGTGLRKESDLFREVASRAVKELPASIDVGTSAIDGVLKSTAEIISQGKEALLITASASDDVEDYSDASDRNNNNNNNNSVRYSRFDAQLKMIRSDVRTYIEEPEDVEEYNKWKLGFVVGEKRDEIEKLVGENGGLEEMYGKLVPNEVDDGTFWFRYFYKVYKLMQQEEMRAKLVKRSLSVDDDEEELSWDVDDDDEEKEGEVVQEQGDKLGSNASKGLVSDGVTDEIKTQSSKVVEKDGDGKNTLKGQDSNDEVITESSKVVDEEGKEMITDVVGVDKNVVEESKLGVGNVSNVEKVESISKDDENVGVKLESGEGKDGDVAVKSNEPSFQEDEDLEWDEIEDLGKTDDKGVSPHGDTTNKEDLRKRLSTAVDEEEDLSWDIEDDDDDDEPVKSGNR